MLITDQTVDTAKKTPDVNVSGQPSRDSFVKQTNNCPVWDPSALFRGNQRIVMHYIPGRALLGDPTTECLVLCQTANVRSKPDDVYDEVAGYASVYGAYLSNKLALLPVLAIDRRGYVIAIADSTERMTAPQTKLQETMSFQPEPDFGERIRISKFSLSQMRRASRARPIDLDDE